MVLLLKNRIAKSIGGYLLKSLQWSSNPQKLNASLWRQAEKKERGCALLNLRKFSSSSLTPLNCGCALLQDNNISSGSDSINKRTLVEVFSVRIIKSLKDIDNIRGLILLRGSDQNYVLYEDPCDERGPQYNSEGYFTLIGPERGVEVMDTLVIYPWLIRLSFDRKTKGKILWKRDSHQLPITDQVIRKGVMCHVGLMQVDFAVYNDRVEARIEITLLDVNLEGESLEIFGTVKASNSMVTGARSTLFGHMTSGECIKISLSPAGESLAVGSAMFDARSRSTRTIEEQIIPGSCAKVKIKAIWST